MKKLIIITLILVFATIIVLIATEPANEIPVKADGSYRIRISYNNPKDLIYDTKVKVASHEILKQIAAFEVKELDTDINGYSHRIELKNWKTNITMCIVSVEKRIISYNGTFYTVDQEHFDELIRLIGEYEN